MKRFTLVIVMGLFFAGVTQAQEHRFSAGIELALPMADFADAAGIGFGASLGYEVPMGMRAAVTGALGVISFTGKEVATGTRGQDYFSIKTAILMVPVQIGLKYYLMENQNGFYLGLQTGIHYINSKVETVTDNILVTESNEDTDSKVSFGVAPGAGYHLLNVDIGLRYQILFEDVSTNYIGVRLAYVFGG